MLELAIFHNGAVDLESAIVDGTRVNTGTLAETSESFQRVLVNQIRQGVLADELGFNYWFMTEHHMQPEGVEFSPNPLIAETAIAARTSRIRLGQMANILTWHHPIRLAEQGAMLDVISGGRVEFGVGRGYQSRETEVLGGAMGSTVQDQERNRAFFQECFDIITKAWTQPSFSHLGEFFSLPPSYTKWGNPSTIAYFSQEHVGRDLDSVLDIGPPDMYSSGPPVYATTTTLKEISVYPQPIQKPTAADVAARHEPPLDRMGRRQRRQLLYDSRAELAPQGERRALLRAPREERLARPPRSPGPVEVRLGLRSEARLRAGALRPHPQARRRSRRP